MDLGSECAKAFAGPRVASVANHSVETGNNHVPAALGVARYAGGWKKNLVAGGGFEPPTFGL